MIRPYRADDLDELLALFRESAHRLGAGDYTPEQLAAWAPETPDREEWIRRFDTGCTLVAEHEGRIAGFVRAEARGYVDLLYVHPECARRGVGSELLRDAIAWLHASGVPRAWTHASHTAKPTFERAGFRAVERRTVERAGVTMENWHMVREPDDAADQ